MPNITLSLPSELHKFVKKQNEINWGEIARRANQHKQKKIKLMEQLVKDSEFTEKNVANLDGKIKENLLNRFKK